ncbi:MAG: nicotinate-nucleotide--dimethylbenzimidazole phosphoribosyltransferase [Dehalococcoidales bacterium]|nr:nicotinate-nucleotide--dimethylbenzimidazole phosphoribosyltransferase [Dehalococcoidales bacterium]
MSDMIGNTVQAIKPLDRGSMALARVRQDTLTKPTGSLGRLEELSVQLAGIQGNPLPQAARKAVIVMVADHGVVAEGVSAYPQEVTAQMVLNFVRGGAAINVISHQVGARVVVVDIGTAGDISSFPGIIHAKISPGTRNMCQGPAMTFEEAVRSIETGIETVTNEIRKGLDIVATGEMGIGNTTASSAICAVMTGQSVPSVTGRGTGLDDQQLSHKIEIIEKAISVNKSDAGKPLEVLAGVGGLEIGGLAGVMLGAAANRVPVMVDGFISGAAALIACGLCPLVKDYLISAHVSVEPGHRQMLQHLGFSPLLDMNMRLGEGTGAALGMTLVEAACRTLSEMATFAEAGVSDKEQ